jgi:hypothetical protein
MLLAEITALIFKVSRIHRHKLTKHVVFDLMHKVTQSITIDEAAFAGGMGMQVEIEHHAVAVLAVELHQGF